MAVDEQIARMTKAIRQAIKVMEDRFGSTELDVEKAVQDLKASLQASSAPNPPTAASPQPSSQPAPNTKKTGGT